eukprot:7386579-Prorocentrum_lima.AAC.1
MDKGNSGIRVGKVVSGRCLGRDMKVRGLLKPMTDSFRAVCSLHRGVEKAIVCFALGLVAW